MFLHIGNEKMVSTEKIIAILDEQSLFSTKKNVQFIGNNHSDDQDRENAKSVIVTDDAVYFSPFSSLTLKRHIETSRSD